MRKQLNITEGIFPMPVLMVATYNEDGSVNVMNAAWGTMQQRDTVALNLTETHKTVKNIKARGAFTVSIADAAHVAEADYFGVVSGNNVTNKFEHSGLTASKSEVVDAPIINEFPLCLECEFIDWPMYADTAVRAKRAGYCYLTSTFMTEHFLFRNGRCFLFYSYCFVFIVC